MNSESKKMMLINNEKEEHFSMFLPCAKTWYSPGQLAKALETTDQYIRNLCESGEILAHVFKSRFRIPRSSVLLLLLKTANYEPELFLVRLMKLIKMISKENLYTIRDYIDKLLKV